MYRAARSSSTQKGRLKHNRSVSQLVHKQGCFHQCIITAEKLIFRKLFALL